MKYVSDKAIESLNISSVKYVEWAEDVLKHKGECLLPPKTSLKMEGNVFYNFMPCIIPFLNRAGIKTVNRYPENTPSLNSNLLLYDLNNGILKGVFDANYITTVRTGAVAVHSIKCFAKKNFQTIACIGLGNVMRATIKILAEYFKEMQFTVKLLRYKTSCENFIAFNKYDNIRYYVANDIKDLLYGGVDVIISGVTYQENDFAEVDWYPPGCLIIPIHTRGFMNCDLVFDKIFVDDYDHVRNFKYFDKFKWCKETSEYVLNKCVGRESDNDRILCYNIGIALQDVYFAEKFLQEIDKHEKNRLG